MTRSLWPTRALLAAAVGVGMIPTDATTLAVVMTFCAVGLAVVAIEASYRHALLLMERDRDQWQAKHREEHESFQRWLRKLGHERHARKS